MSKAAELRYEKFAAREAAEKCGRSINDLYLADLNALPKKEGAQAPFGDIVFVQSRGGWVAECPVTGFGFWYKTLRLAVASWVVAVFLVNGSLVGQPCK